MLCIEPKQWKVEATWFHVTVTVAFGFKSMLCSEGAKQYEMRLISETEQRCFI